MRLTAYPWAILAILLVVAPCAAAPAIASSHPSASFDQYKADGDRARLEKRWQDAIDAYEQALAIRKDAIVTGYAGFVLTKLERFDEATGLLQRAANDMSTAMPAALRQFFFNEFVRSAEQVCRVDVHVDQANARVEIDGGKIVNDRADFYVFLNPGVHTISAQKAGFHDAVQTLMTDRACKRNVALIMQSIPIEQLSLDKYRRVVPQNPSPDVEVRDPRSREGALSGAKPPPNPYEPSRKRWFVGGAGVWIPFYVTSGVALGVLGHGGARLFSNFEIGLEIKAAMHVLTLDKNEPFGFGAADAWSLGLTPCGRIFDRFFFCVIPQMTGGKRLNSGQPPWLRLGFGGRLGLEFHRTNRVHLRIFGEIAVLSSTLSQGSNREGFTREAGLTFPSLGTSVAFF